MERTDPLVIDVAGHPDLEQLVAKVAEGRDCTLVREGRRVAVVTAAEGESWRTPTAEDLAVALSALGGWADVDTERFLADIYAHRDMDLMREPVHL